MRKRTAQAVIGLCFGDEGKGTVIDYLSSLEDVDVVRYNGGPQATHNVITNEGMHHCFSQIGSGAFHGANTHIYKEMLIQPQALEAEFNWLKAKMCRDLSPIRIHPECIIVTPYHRYVGRLNAFFYKFSTTGIGVGAAYDCAMNYNYVLRLTDLSNKEQTNRILQVIRKWAKRKVDWFQTVTSNWGSIQIDEEIDEFYAHYSVSDLVARYEEFYEKRGSLWDWWDIREIKSSVILESSQGALLDRRNSGYWPHISPVDIAIKPSTLEELNITSLQTWGVTRSYLVRHGIGFFPSKDDSLLYKLSEMHNYTNPYQGHVRRGWLDLNILAKGVEICGNVDKIFLTCVDKTDRLKRNKVYLQYTRPRFAFPKNEAEISRLIENRLNIPIKGISRGPRTSDKELL